MKTFYDLFPKQKSTIGCIHLHDDVDGFMLGSYFKKAEVSPRKIELRI